jgi:hypothetical protein
MGWDGESELTGLVDRINGGKGKGVVEVHSRK